MSMRRWWPDGRGEAFAALSSEEMTRQRAVLLSLRPLVLLSDGEPGLSFQDRLENLHGTPLECRLCPAEWFEPFWQGCLEVLRASEACQRGQPIGLLTDALLSLACRWEASDVRFEPEERGLRVRMRLDGRLQDLFFLSSELGNALVSALKVSCGMDIANRRAPQDGRATAAFDGQTVDLRCSTLPTLWGEVLALRLLRRSGFLTLDRLGACAGDQQVLESLCRQSSGLILSVGPTGSGKTTTQHALLRLLDRRHKNLITLEDPVEYHLEGVNQVVLNEAAGCDFHTALRALLRQDPDVAVVGEIRDLTTATLALRLALTGHLVFSTLHTIDSPSALLRLVEMGCPPYLVASCVRAVIAQRLVRRLRDGEYLGRFGLFEILSVDDPLRELLLQGADLARLRAAARRGGCVSLRRRGLEAVERGWTGLEEVLSLTPEDWCDDAEARS